MPVGLFEAALNAGRVLGHLADVPGEVHRRDGGLDAELVHAQQ
ncbi:MULTISPECIES: hypothetical protein [Haloarcula]|nr:hypothetical protein [Halomicroarcula sp. XH51]